MDIDTPLEYFYLVFRESEIASEIIAKNIKKLRAIAKFQALISRKQDYFCLYFVI